MTTYNQVMSVAKSHLGHGGSHARAFCHLGSGQPYCCAYVRMCTSEAGGGKLFYGGKMVTYCPAAIRWCKAHLAEVPPYLAMPMDFIFFDWQPNGTPDHIGFVLEKIDTDKIKTLEGNTSGHKVATKTRSGYIQGIFRPHYEPNRALSKGKLDVDGDFGYHSIYMLQVALGLNPTGILTKETVKALQKKVGTVADGAWGRKTSLKVQACVGAKKDGEFGPESVKAFQKYINKKNGYGTKKTTTAKKTAASTKAPATAKKPATEKKDAAKKTSAANKKASKTPKADKLIATMKELAWAYGTAKKKYAYKTGAPKKVCKAAMKKYGWADSKAEMSDCGNFVSTVVRESGVSKTFKALHGTKTPFPKSEKGFQIIHKGKKIPDGLLKPGDIVRYKKTNGNQHVLFYFGDGKVCEASHFNLFGVIRKDGKRYNSSKAKKSTIQVLRVKE